MKKGINSRAKGVRFEQEASRMWANIMGYSFRRTRGSGAGLTPGDIAPFSENQAEYLKWAKEFPFIIECKNNERIEFHHLLVNPETSFIWKSWLQAVEGVERTGKIPFLMLTKNHYPTLCMTTLVGKARLNGIIKELHGEFIYNNNNKFIWFTNIEGYEEEQFVIFQWKKINE